MRKEVNALIQRKDVSDKAFDVPVVVDDVKRYGKLKMARCTYFTIECDAPSSNWVLELGKKSIPFLLIGLSGLIVRPIRGGRLFESSDSIDELFDTIESHPSLYVDINDLWLPNKLFQGLPHGRIQGFPFRFLTILAMPAVGAAVMRGIVIPSHTNSLVVCRERPQKRKLQ